MSKCNNCKTEAIPSEETCSICHYPISGSEKEKGVFIANQVILKSQVKEAAEGIKVVRISLFVIAGYFLLSTIIALIIIGDFENILGFSIELAIGLIISGLFIFFGFMTYKRPKAATLIPLVIVLIYYTILFFLFPKDLARGIYWKAFIVMILSFGYYRVARSNYILKKHAYIAQLLGYSRINERGKGPLEKNRASRLVLDEDLD